MKMAKALILLTMSVYLSGFTVVQAAPVSFRSELMASVCLACHGPGAKGSLKIPPLNDLTVSDIQESMFGFKSGEERSTIMGIIAKDYRDADIKMLADYFAALPD